MYPKGIIYQSGKSGLRGEVAIAASRMVRIGYGLARGIGAGLVGFATIAVVFTFGPVAKEEINYRLGNSGLSVASSPTSYNLLDFAEADRVEAVQEEANSFGVNSYFSVVVPKIGAVSNIIANVDPGDEDEYSEALAKGVAHAAGTYFPGQGNSIYLFSHSTDSSINVSRYNAIFYLLRKLDVGDSVFIYFADKRYEYVVEEKVVTSADDVSWLAPSTDGERLVLQTCDPPGTTWRRLIVVARPRRV